MGVLSRSFRVTAYDLRGHGYSDVPPSGYTSGEQAGDPSPCMDALGIERAMLVGHSFGGVIATHAAALYPDRIEAVVLSDPYFPALRHLEDLSRWGHWQNFREEAADAGVTLSDGALVRPAEVLRPGACISTTSGCLKFRQAVGLPGLKRLLRLAPDDLRRRLQGSTPASPPT